MLAFGGLVFHQLERAEPVKVEQSRLVRDAGGIHVDGKLHNRGADEGPIDLEVRYFDSSGRTIGQDKIQIEKLAGGAETDFHSSARNIAGVASFSIYLNHGRNPYGN